MRKTTQAKLTMIDKNESVKSVNSYLFSDIGVQMNHLWSLFKFYTIKPYSTPPPPNSALVDSSIRFEKTQL